MTDDAGNTGTDRVNVTVIDRPEVGPPPFPGEANAPTDPDGDGLYENINGDERFNIIDVSVFLVKFGSVSAENAAAFDFNSDGQINIIDVAALLDRT